MDYIQLIAELCAIIDQQNTIIQDQAMELGQLDTLRHAEEIAALRHKYAEAIGGPVDRLEVQA